jgi:hypothetical protein
MADFSFTPAATGIKPVQGMSLGEMMNTARGAQQYQQSAQLMPIELQRAQAEANVAQQTQDPRISSAKSAASTAETGSQSALMDFQNKMMNGITNRLTGLINNPLIIAAERNPESVDPVRLENLINQYGQEQAQSLGIPKEKSAALLQPYLAQAKNPAGIRQFLKEKMLATLDQSARVGALQPSGLPVSTGAGGFTAAQNEFGAAVPGTPLPGTTYTTQLPPTQQLVATQNDGTGLPVGTPYVLGPQGQPKAVNKPLATGLDPASLGTLTANTKVANDDWAETYKNSEGAQQRIGIYQNIRKLAPEAFTGVGGARKELAAGIANAVGWDAYSAEKTATDELMKNSNLLSLTGGNTDAARLLAEAANPNKKMNEKAIKEVVGQLIGVEKMKSAKANYLGQFRNNPDKYVEQTSVFNNVADSRLFQEADAAFVAKMKASMSPREQQEFGDKVRQARKLGIIQ